MLKNAKSTKKKVIEIEPSVLILSDINYQEMLLLIEKAGRTCYKSTSEYSINTGEVFCKKIIKLDHLSVLEHQSITVRFICSRSCSHQLVRSRIASYSQESQRYVKTNEMKYICPPDLRGRENFQFFMELAAEHYNYLLKNKFKPEDARFVLPNACATEIVTTMNLRSWRYFFKLRCDSHAQWEIRGLAKNLLKKYIELMPAFFEDLNELTK